MNKKEQQIHIEFHADDYALFPTQSHRILDCHRNGKLNGLSIMPNSPYLGECVSDLYPFLGNMAVTVHLNLMEGRSLCDPNQVPLLTNAQGHLNCGFGSLLLRSFLPGREKLRQQLKQELKAQILAVRKELPKEVPLRLYLPHFFRLRDLSPINLVKVAVLNLLSGMARLKYRKELQPMEKKLFLGVALSGRMYYENLKVFFPQAMKLAGKKGWDLEILGHPGGVFEEEDIAQITSADDKTFLTSPLRDREKSMFLINL